MSVCPKKCQKVSYQDSDNMCPRRNYTQSLCTDFSHTCSLEGFLEPSLNLLSLQILLHEISFVPPQINGVTNGTSHLIYAKMTNTNFVPIICLVNIKIFQYLFLFLFIAIQNSVDLRFLKN